MIRYFQNPFFKHIAKSACRQKSSVSEILNMDICFQRAEAIPFRHSHNTVENICPDSAPPERRINRDLHEKMRSRAPALFDRSGKSDDMTLVQNHKRQHAEPFAPEVDLS
jgi:hypothetical protein